jgi:two-component system, chemotaxis family, CheB/CheR fusion protein
VLDLFAFSLQQSRGYLFLGKAETARPTKAAFELINKKWKIYRCMSGPVHFPVYDSALFSGVSSNSWREPRRRQFVVSALPNPSDITQAEVDTAQLRRINETILRHTNVAVVIIDRSYRILTINAAARRLLGIRELAYDQDFLHAVRGIPYHEVRRAIDTAFREHSTITLPELELDHPTEGAGRYVNVAIMVMQVENGAPELAVMTVHDITEQVQTKKRLEAVQQEHSELFGELSTANKRFSSVNKELQDANEELQAANEELMLTQEELQATNEEFEATNEELQATNEELETNNEELQATNEELQTTNEELTFRTAELQELAKQHRLEQLQLSVLLERFPHYVMVLNADDLTVHAVNPAYKDLFAGREVQGLTIVDVFSGQEVEQLVKLLRQVIQDTQSVKTAPMLASAENQNTGQKFMHTIVPITNANSSEVNRLFIYSERVE